MLTGISRRVPLLLAIAVIATLTWGGNTPALAACTPGAADKPDLGFVDSNCDGAHVLVVDGSVVRTANGGKGGNGGAGGAGGRGGPGAGGASIGVLAIDARAVVSADTQVTVGSGGLGGVGSYNGWVGLSLKSIQLTTLAGSLPAMGDFDGDGLDDSADACAIAPGGGNGYPADAPAPPPNGGQTGSVPTTGSGSESGATPVSTATPATGTVTVSVLPASSCVSRSIFRVRINARRAHLKTGRLTLNRHRLRLVKGPRIWTARVDLRRSTRTRHTLTLRGTLRDGRPYKQVRRYRTCVR